jgi:hypothetical protein
MSLLTYEDVRPWARSIKTKVTNREMPPWHIDRNIGITKFKNDPSLTDQEIATIAKWVDAGAPRGNPADMPPPRKFEELDQWFIGKPDIVITSNKPYVLPAAGPDNIVDILVDPGFKEDMYVMAIESKPADAASFKVTHTLHDEPCRGSRRRSGWLFLNEYALGKNGDVFPPNSGRLIKAGTKINFNLHLNPRGEETPVNVKLGLKVYPKGQVPKYVAFTQHMGDAPDLDIPAGAISRHDGYFRLPRPVLLARSSRTCTTAARPSASKRSIPISIQIRRGRDRLAPRPSVASATTSSAGTSPTRMLTTWRRSCRRAR